MVTLVLIGVLIGLVLGLTGAGGSVFAVPLLILLAGVSMTVAGGLSFGTVAASTIYASVRSGIQQHTILWKPGAILALVGAVSAPLLRWLRLQIPEPALIVSVRGTAGRIDSR